MLDFILNHLFVIIAVIVILMLLSFVFRFATRIVLVLGSIAIVGCILFGPKFLNNFQKPIEATKEFAQSTIQPVIKSELNNAKFSFNPTTKKYVIQSTSFKLEGVSDENKADVMFKGKKYTIDVTFLKSFIQDQIAQQTKK
jgi:hypothetical protein